MRRSVTEATLSASGGKVSIAWTNGYLQQASFVAGTSLDVSPINQPSPYVIGTSNPAQYFRVSSQP
ncbi:MAG TPA: hypothetical protein VH619_11095 [Verrucomicrobiae bacterium]|nr:hypothetical protein [Verrucomicrobiae bacterium]